MTEGDADDFRRSLAERLGDNTVRRHCSRARQFFGAAVKRRLLGTNPFGSMKRLTVQGSPDRFYFVTVEETEKVLAACPDGQWRLLVALARFGGLRTPSESLLVAWRDVDWAASRLTVHSPKTEHCGKGTRVVPIFPELLPHLEAAWEQAEPGAEFAVTRYRDGRQNLRTHLERIICSAGLNPWPKPWQNMRSSRETELVETYPVHVVTNWLGNTPAVAARHYLQTTDQHFQRAIGKPDEKAQRKAQQSGAELART